jgi:ABC-type molybdate transport system substrate-binding protein
LQDYAPTMQAPYKPVTQSDGPAPGAAAAPVQIYAAGSLKAVFGDMARAMAADGIAMPQFTFGASGLLKDRIAGGEACDVFASANMAHPQALAPSGEPVRVFARNTLCALTRADLEVNPDNLVERMLDPVIRLGTSTPGADPSGDYAQIAIAKAETVHPGTAAALRAKARALTGGPSSPRPANGYSVYSEIMAQGDADIFLTYVTNALTVTRKVQGTAIVALPPELAVAAEYGLVVLSEREAAGAVAGWILSPAGQAILVQHGFLSATR